MRRHIGKQLDVLIENAICDGVKTDRHSEGSQSAGSIRTAEHPKKESQRFLKEPIPVRYLFLVNDKLPSNEAEFAAFLVWGRMGIETFSEAYLSGYLGDNQMVPPISLA
jgi:hypothetical protein